MSSTDKTVDAKNVVKGMWIWVTVEKGPIRVQVTTVRPAGRGFVRVGFKHPTVGSHSIEFSNWARLDLAP